MKRLSLILCLLVFITGAFAQDTEEYEIVFIQGLKALVEGKYDQAISCFKQAIEILPDEPVSYYNIACAYSLKNDVENALVWFEKAVDKGFDDYDHLLIDTDIDNIRNTEKFKQILERLKVGKLVKIAKEALPGGYMAQDANKPEIQKKAKEAAKLLFKEHPSYKFVKVHEAATQVVAGVNYYFLLEFSTAKGRVVWEVIMYENLGGEREISKARQVKAVEEENIPGGYSRQDVNARGIKKRANKAAEMLAKKHPGYKLVKIHEAATQVVAGINFYFILEFSAPRGNVLWEVIMYESFSGECEISEAKRIGNKPVNPRKDALPGGYLTQDVDAPEIQKMANEATALLAKSHPDYKLVKVHEAATQVVAGTNYFFVLELATSKGNVVWHVIMYQGFSGECELSEARQVE